MAAETPVVNTTTSEVSGVVGEQQIKDLPLNGRSFDNLITLNPGAVNYSAMKSAGTSTSNGNTFSVDGRRTYENLILLNGIEYTGSSQLAISPAASAANYWGSMPFASSTRSPTPTAPSTESARARKSAWSRNREPISCTARCLNFFATAIWTRATF